MTNTLIAPETHKTPTEINPGDSFSWRPLFDQLARTLPLTQAALVTTMPRGTLQIVQPGKFPEAILKAYGQEFHREDRATWQAIITGRPLRGQQAWNGAFESSRYLLQFLRPRGLEYLAVVPLAAPILNGYPGALQVWRAAELGDFTDAELTALGRFATQMDQTLQDARTERLAGDCAEPMPWVYRPVQRQFVYNEQAELVLRDPREVIDPSKEELFQEMAQYARQKLHQLNGEAISSDRLQLANVRGDYWTFRVVTHKDYPALGGGPFVLFCLQPGRCDWSTIRTTDFQADRELARLIPALRYMQQEFHRGPTLGDIARQVHLSPFHFHRQFTELLGLTPKHFLLECQIFEAKRQLVAREKNLAQIAKDCGFAHQSHFTSRFKQATGLTPTRWRRLANEYMSSQS